MATPQAHELRTMPTSARPAAVSNVHTQLTMVSTDIVNNSALYPPHSSRFYLGLLSRARPEPGPSFCKKFNSVYTAIGLALTLILTCVTYRLSVHLRELSQWTARKDYHELCLELRQANLTLLEDCNTVLINGFARPPTFISKRWLDKFDMKPLADHSALWYAKMACSVQKQGDTIGAVTSHLCHRSNAGPFLPPIVGKLHNVTLNQYATIPALGGTSFDRWHVHLALIALAVWMTCSGVRLISICLHRKHVKTISERLETSFTDLRGAGLSDIDNAMAHLQASQMPCLALMHVRRTWTSVTGVLLPQVHDFGLSLAIFAIEQALKQWLTQVLSQNGVLRDREVDSSITLTTSDNDIVEQINGVSGQGKTNRRGRKRKSS